MLNSDLANTILKIYNIILKIYNIIKCQFILNNFIDYYFFIIIF